MAGLPNFIEGAAFGVLNDILAGFRDNNGFAQPNRYEIIIIPPAKIGGGGNENIFNNQERQSDLRKISLRASSVTLPGRNLATAQESNVYGPDREIVEGVTYADDISMQFQASSGLDERVYFENWQRQAFNEKTWNIGYYNDYISTIEMYVLDKDSDPLYISENYAHGYLTLEPHTIFTYAVNGTYDPYNERSIKYQDVDLIRQVIKSHVRDEKLLIISEKDKNGK